MVRVSANRGWELWKTGWPTWKRPLAQSSDHPKMGPCCPRSWGYDQPPSDWSHCHRSADFEPMNLSIFQKEPSFPRTVSRFSISTQTCKRHWYGWTECWECVGSCGGLQWVAYSAYWGLDLSRIFLLKSHLDWRPPHETQFYCIHCLVCFLLNQMFLLFYLRASSLFLYSSWCSWLNRVAGAFSRCKNLIPHTCLGAYSTRSTIMTVTFSRYILVWERTLEQSSHTTEWARTLRFGAGLLVPLQGAAAGCCSAAVRVLCGLWSWVALQLQGCRCRVPLQGAAECCLRFGAAWCALCFSQRLPHKMCLQRRDVR